MISNKANVERHKKMVHEKIKNYKCEICDKFFYAKSCLKRHQSEVHGSQKVRCNQCPLMFSNKGNMERHVKMVHEMIKNYKCESCTKSFFAKADQETYHSEVHDGQKVKCNECSMMFTNKWNMVRHVASEVGPKSSQRMNIIHENRLKIKLSFVSENMFIITSSGK